MQEATLFLEQWDTEFTRFDTQLPIAFKSLPVHLKIPSDGKRRIHYPVWHCHSVSADSYILSPWPSSRSTKRTYIIFTGVDQNCLASGGAVGKGLVSLRDFMLRQSNDHLLTCLSNDLCDGPINYPKRSRMHRIIDKGRFEGRPLIRNAVYDYRNMCGFTLSPRFNLDFQKT